MYALDLIVNSVNTNAVGCHGATAMMPYSVEYSGGVVRCRNASYDRRHQTIQRRFVLLEVGHTDHIGRAFHFETSLKIFEHFSIFRKIQF